MQINGESKRTVLVTITVLWTMIYIFWRVFFTLPIDYGMISLLCGILLLIVEIVGLLESGVHFYNMTHMMQVKKPEEIDKNQYPYVDVFIATYNEPVSLLYKTINGCKHMEYPNKELVHIYLCDDGNREEVRMLAEEMGIEYITRPEHKDAKAGNLNHALSKTNSPLIVTLDADMIPMHDFLMTCAPYFLAEEKIGFIQLPQSFYNPDLFQYNLFSEHRIPNEQDYFYQDIQVAKNRMNAVIYGGSNTMLAREALEEIGGFVTGVITEDFATGILIQDKGYRCYAVNEIHASGLSPSDLKSLVKQRARWARGCIQTGRKLHFIWKKGLNWKQKLNYFVSISYWYFGLKRVAYIMAPVLFAVFGIHVVECNIVEVVIFWLPTYLLTNTCLSLLSNRIRNIKWTNVYETILFPSLFFPVLLETFGISQKKFAVTKKDRRTDERSYRITLMIPHIVFLVLTVIGIVRCIEFLFLTGSPGYFVVLFWLIVNSYSLAMAIFFMLGRKMVRNAERFAVTLPCQIDADGQVIDAITQDISEGGVAICLELPIYIDYTEKYKLTIHSVRYKTTFLAQVAHVEQYNAKWKYAFRIIEIDKLNYDQLLQILHDRVPTLPHSIMKDSVYEDVVGNVAKRNKKQLLFQRKLPRIDLQEELVAITKDGEKQIIEMINFNYEYVLFVIKEDRLIEDRYWIPIEESKMQIECELIKDYMPYKVGTRLYKIKNLKKLIQTKEFHKQLQKWVHHYEKQKVVSINQNKKNEEEDYDEMMFI